MTSFQKVIKYCAIAFAILLAIGIISGIASAVFGVVSAISGNMGYTFHDRKTIDVTETFTGVKSLDIDNSTGNLKIETGETFQIVAERVSESFEAKVSGDGVLRLYEDESDFKFFGINFDGLESPNSKITLYLPADFVAEETKIETGAGAVSIEGLQTEYLYISAGAGNITGSNVSAGKVKIDGGVGNVDLEEVVFEDADFDCGVGNLDIQGVLTGKNEIDCGVGGVSLDLAGDLEDYDLDIDAGVGTIRINGEKISGEANIDNHGGNSIKIDGGVGDVRINIK